MNFTRHPRLSRFVRGVVGTALALAGVAFLVVSDAEARTGGGSNAGSRGSKTFTAPPTTNTAPKAAAPVQRSATTAGATSTAAGAAKTGGFMSKFGGIGGLLAGGLIGAALMSAFGLGGGLAGMLGMLLQVALIAGVIFLVVNFIRNRRAQSNGMANGPAMAQASAAERQTLAPQQPYQNAPAGAFNGAAGTTALTLGEVDFNAFGTLLAEIQTAYGREDEPTMRSLTTPEMLGYLGEDVNANMDKGVRNELSDVKLLQGDLSEAWSEGDSDYATVAMRYSLIDVMVDRKSGKLVSGSKTVPEEVTELWTFVRPRRASVNAWKLSAIQQA
jgi:predicted lipid-binding transport protein (Tim44 family)